VSSTSSTSASGWSRRAQSHEGPEREAAADVISSLDRAYHVRTDEQGGTPAPAVAQQLHPGGGLTRQPHVQAVVPVVPLRLSRGAPAKPGSLRPGALAPAARPRDGREDHLPSARPGGLSEGLQIVLGLRLGLRARLWRVSAETEAPGAILEAADVQALREMARPGLEPGTPRFSVSRARSTLIGKDLQIRLFHRVPSRRDGVGYRRLRARLGLCGGVGVPMSRGDEGTGRAARLDSRICFDATRAWAPSRAKHRTSLLGLCDAWVPDHTRASRSLGPLSCG
jgi:hypothetical protein